MDLEHRLENMEETLADIKQNDPAKGDNITTDYNDIINDFHQLVVKAKSVSSLLEKANYYYLNEKKVLELNLLFNAYCKIKANNLNDEDLSTASLNDYTNGNTLTLEAVEQRLAALGWKG